MARQRASLRSACQVAKATYASWVIPQADTQDDVLDDRQLIEMLFFGLDGLSNILVAEAKKSRKHAPSLACDNHVVDYSK